MTTTGEKGRVPDEITRQEYRENIAMLTYALSREALRSLDRGEVGECRAMVGCIRHLVEIAKVEDDRDDPICP